MVHYDKKVVYLSEMEYGNKRRGAGFVRMECRGESCSFDMHVSGMGTLAERKYDIAVMSARGKEYRIGKIFIHNGSGDWRGVYEKGEVTGVRTEEGEGEGIPYREVAEILVKISDTKVLAGKTPFCERVMQAAEITAGGTADKGGQSVSGVWKGKDLGERGERTQKGRKESMENEAAAKMRGKEKEAAGAEEGIRGRRDEEEGSRTEEGIKNGKKEKERTAAERSATGKQPEENAEGSRGIWKFVRGGAGHGEKGDRQGTAGEEDKIQIDDVILNDKWDQLKQLYSVVHPYEDDRQYIAIQPKDFVIMTGDYQHLANNSFLLHGFYNYRHIVLGRERDGSFYLGVPGVYYEREKMVALMFGFEAFECTGGNAEAGKFGYYLRKVKI